MPITAISRDWSGGAPDIVRIVSSDNLAAITTAGYWTSQLLNVEALNHGVWEWLDTDYVLISYSGGKAFFLFDAINLTFDAAAVIPGTLSDTLTSAHLFVGNGANIATDVPLTGDISIDNTGLSAIVAGVIVNADISAAAAIAFSKLATLASGNVLVGSAGGVPTSVAMSGDVGIVATGVTTIAANAITTTKILNANVTLAKLAAGITPSHVIKFAGQPTTVGGAAAEAFVVAGALATDLAFVQIVNDGAANVTVLQAVVTAGVLTVTFSANPGADTVFNYQIIRAAA